MRTPVGYVPHERTLVVDEPQARRIRDIFRLYLEMGCVRGLKTEIDRLGWTTPIRKTRRLAAMGGKPFSRGHLYRILSNPIYIGKIAHKEEVFEGNHPAIIDEVLWQAVQDQIGNNLRVHRTRSMAADPSLLTGLVYDNQGNRLTPTHTKNGARRYRYYVSNPLIESGRKLSQEGLRLPARELEEVVLQSMAQFLMDESRLAGLMDDVAAGEMRSRMQHAKGLAKVLLAQNFSGKIDVLSRVVQRITVYEDNIQIVVRTDAVWSLNNTPVTGDTQTTLIEVPVKLKKCGLAVRLIVKATGVARTRKPDPKIIALITKGHEWLERLTSGRDDSLGAIAKEEKVSGSYITQLIYLAFLDPDIIQQILKGNYPEELTAKRLMQIVPLPVAWSEQRAVLGMHD